MDLASGSVYTIPTIIFGVSIGLIKILECIQMKYISNTKLIIKQSRHQRPNKHLHFLQMLLRLTIIEWLN